MKKILVLLATVLATSTVFAAKPAVPEGVKVERIRELVAAKESQKADGTTAKVTYEKVIREIVSARGEKLNGLREDRVVAAIVVCEKSTAETLANLLNKGTTVNRDLLNKLLEKAENDPDVQAVILVHSLSLNKSKKSIELFVEMVQQKVHEEGLSLEMAIKEGLKAYGTESAKGLSLKEILDRCKALLGA